jgi:hypothetical protein
MSENEIETKNVKPPPYSLHADKLMSNMEPIQRTREEK